MTSSISDKVKEYQRLYRIAHRDQSREYFRKRYLDNTEKFKKYRDDNKEKLCRKSKEYNNKHKVEIKARRRIYNLSVSEINKIKYQKKRIEVLNGYGGRCVCCKEARPNFLSIDHINGNGHKMRREKTHPTSAAFYAWLKKGGYPKEFRVLCHNCNFSLGKYGYCPHGNL